MSAPRIAVITFPGSNDDGDARLALDGLGASAVAAWHADDALPEGTTGVLLPGGFSYGDYLRCGAIARFAPIMDDVARFAAAGGPVLGICNGFQILCESRLLPGVLRPNDTQQFMCRDVTVVVETTCVPFTERCAVGDELVIPVKNGEGAWFGDNDLVHELETRDQIVLRYTEDLNGSRDRVAGVTNEAGNVMGLMPHPEHAVDPLLGPVGGRPILVGLVDAARAWRGVPVLTD